MAQLKRPAPFQGKIPSASMPDIIFTLLIFFMVVTSFKQFDGLPVIVPEAKTTAKIEVGKRDIAYIWIDKYNQVVLDDQMYNKDDLSELTPILYQRRTENPKTVISLKADRDCRMKVVTDVQQQCRKAYTLRINYTTRFKDQG
ncbi:MAG: biopolymer transporter ExbD [bacterium]|jgi:biopolymer transport protein ExbD|nr:biopolymer transporter ExbD [bacterium]